MELIKVRKGISKSGLGLKEGGATTWENPNKEDSKEEALERLQNSSRDAVCVFSVTSSTEQG